MDVELAPDWQEWVLENLLDDVPRDELTAHLVNHDVPGELARSAVATIAASPAFRAARAVVIRREQLADLRQLRAELERTNPDFAEIPRRSGVSGRDFFASFYSANRPVILTDVTQGWPALDLWDLDYFAEKLANVEVSANMGRNADPLCDRNFKNHLTPMTMKAFVAWLRSAGTTNDGYLTSNSRAMESSEMRALLDDVIPPEQYVDPARAEHHMSFWLGPAGTVTPLHHDGNNILFCQVLGRKRVQLVSPSEAQLVEEAEGYYARPSTPGVGLTEGALPVSHYDVVLQPGDALFIPVGWWHQVTALDVSASISFLNFRANNQFKWFAPGKRNKDLRSQIR